MGRTITRRELALGALAVSAALAQSSPSAPAETPESLLAGARKRVQNTRERLAKFDLPMAAEPAFQFRA